MRVITSQKLLRDSGESMFAARHQDVSQGPLIDSGFPGIAPESRICGKFGTPSKAWREEGGIKLTSCTRI